MASVSEIAAGVLGGGAIGGVLTAIVAGKSKHRESLDAEFASIRRELKAQNEVLEKRVDDLERQLSGEQNTLYKFELLVLNLIRYRFDDREAWEEVATGLEEKHGSPKRRRTDVHAHILVADDDRDNREIVGKVLAMQGLNVELAENGTQALRMYDAAVAASDPFDMVILDYQMPGATGGDVAKAIRRDRRDTKTQVVIFTAFGGDNALDEMLSGMDVHLWAKPLTSQEIASRTDKLVRTPATG